MNRSVTLNELEELALALSDPEQLELIAFVGERLGIPIDKRRLLEGAATGQLREIKADALLKELDAIADSIEGEFDSAADIRQVRAERAEAL